MVELAQVLYQQATCEGWSSSNWMLYLMMHYHLAALQNTSMQTLAPPELHSKLIGCSIISAVLALLAKWKWRSITGGGSWSSRSTALTVSCHGLSCEHTLSSHAAIFHSAGHLLPRPLCSPGPGQRTPPPNHPFAPCRIRSRCVVENCLNLTAQVMRWRVGHTHVHTGNPVVKTNIGPFNSCLQISVQILSAQAGIGNTCTSVHDDQRRVL